jgi:hypothetical protein
MKKVIGFIGALLCFAAIAQADVHTYSTTVTNGQPITYSEALPVSGWLDKIEVVQESAATSTVTVATYSGTSAIDTYATKAISAAVGTVFRPRFIGTSNAGTAFTSAAVAASTNLAAGTVLVAGYERPMIGSNVKVAVTGTANDGSNTVTVRIFYEPLKK